jgi:hypothetical protein
MRKPRKTKKRNSAAAASRLRSAVTPPTNRDSWQPQPVLRRLLGNPSAVTWWRWRHNKKLGMPPLKEINGRLYGQWGAFSDWWANLPNAKQFAA